MAKRFRGQNKVAPAFAATLCLAVTGAAMPTLAAEQLVAAEKNPPGDIPDTQVFILSTSAFRAPAWH